jgi:predicted dehydrogenase
MKRLLVVGCGSIGERHIRCLKAVGGAEVWACDPRPERLAQMRELYDAAGGVPSMEAARLSDFDAALICTPTDQHISQALAAAEAGCHLFVEKPISTTLEGVADLIALSAKTRRVLQVGYVFRHHPALKEAKSLLDAGAIGPVHQAAIKVGSFIGKYRPDYAQLYWAHAQTGGGVLMDATHQVDYIQWLLGPIVRVATQRRHYVIDVDPDVEDAACLLLEFASGAMAMASFNNFQPNYKHTLELNGTCGSIEWSYVENELRIYEERDRSWRTHQAEWERDDFYENQMRNFLAAMDGAEAPGVTGEDGLRALRVALAARKAADTGQWVEVE